MPRLTISTYLSRHYQLKALWAEDERRFMLLSWSDQADLHRYYQPTLHKTDAELVAYRRDVHAVDPSLPQRAGRAYARLMRGEEAPSNRSVEPNGRVIIVRALARPEPDLRLLARLFIDMAKRDIEEEARDNRAA